MNHWLAVSIPVIHNFCIKHIFSKITMDTSGNKISIMLAFLCLLSVISSIAVAQISPEPKIGDYAGHPDQIRSDRSDGLLFYLSADNDFRADYSAGISLPNFLANVNLTTGVSGTGVSSEDNQLLTYWAPGNIYAQRGTVSFFWRSRYPVGPTPFPIFRVGYADHKSWDMVWLRIDYNGYGFDAFVTDVGLSRTRVSYYMDEFPKEDEWIHIAFAWDETQGVYLYIDGELVASSSNVGSIYDTGLDQFGPNSRIISPYQVQSRYVFKRGGDLDELRIYDRMLTDSNISELSKLNPVISVPSVVRDFSQRVWRDAWWTRHGWNLPNAVPPKLITQNTTIKKVEIQNSTDVRRWNGGSLDGIRETTWPGVYNMSRLPGRHDYFILPDWDAYSVSGQTITYHLPEEEWNHIEIFGTAWGQLTHLSNEVYENTFAVRHKSQVKSYHRIEHSKIGGDIRFDNALIEEPIGSFMVYNVQAGSPPQGVLRRSYTLRGKPDSVNESIARIENFIYGRHPSDERSMLYGSTDHNIRNQISVNFPQFHQPIVHIIIPYEQIDRVGLDGVIIELPAFQLNPTHKGLVPFNIRVKDPLWELRDLMDFSFSLAPGNAQTLWLDLRDRILPEDRALYLTISSASQEFNSGMLAGAKITLVYNSIEIAKNDHVQDRLRQVKTLHAHNVEENPRSPRLNSFNRFMSDVNDILKVDPTNWLGKAYKFWVTRDNLDKPEYQVPIAPSDKPEWAFRQIEYMKHMERIINFYIDERQISNGEFGGGLSDDGDFTNKFPGTALLGIQSDKIFESLKLHMEAYFNQERHPYDAALKQRSLPLFTNGLATIMTDELHAYEDGIQVVGQMQLLDHGNPLYVNRNMHTAKRILEDVTQYAPDGHRRFRSRYYGGTQIAYEEPWMWAVPNSYIMVHSAFKTIRHNGNEQLKSMVVELADMLLDTKDDDGNIYGEIHFKTGETRGDPGVARLWGILLGAYEYTGDYKYRQPIEQFISETREFNPSQITNFYNDQIERMGLREYISTHGSVWIDRVERFDHEIQNHRLGGVAMTRINHTYPQHRIGWHFKAPYTYEDLAIYVTKGTRSEVKYIAYNLSDRETLVSMSTWEIEPGQWNITIGVDTNSDGIADQITKEMNVYLERGLSIDLEFEQGKQFVVEMKLISPGVPYWDRPDHAISKNDIKISSNEILIRVHNIGSISTIPTILHVTDKQGKILQVQVPVIDAPIDLIPKFVDIKIPFGPDFNFDSGSIHIDPFERSQQITRNNTLITW